MSPTERCYELFGLPPFSPLGDGWIFSSIKFLCDEKQVIAYWAIPVDAVIVALVLLYYRRLDARINRGEDPRDLRNGLVAVTIGSVLIFAVVLPQLVVYENVVQLTITFLSVAFIVWRKGRFDERYIRNLR